MNLIGLVRLEGRQFTIAVERGFAVIESRVDESGVSARLAIPRSSLGDVMRLLADAREQLAAAGER